MSAVPVQRHADAPRRVRLSWGCSSCGLREEATEEVEAGPLRERVAAFLERHAACLTSVQLGG